SSSWDFASTSATCRASPYRSADCNKNARNARTSRRRSTAPSCARYDGSPGIGGSPGEIRTLYLSFRKRTLYPNELRGHLVRAPAIQSAGHVAVVAYNRQTVVS